MDAPPSSRPHRGGRPRLAADQVKVRRVVVLLSEAAHAALQERARGACSSLSAFLRDAGTGRKPRPTVPAVNYLAVSELNRLGNNLNQLVAAVHAHILPQDLLPVLLELRELLPLSKAELTTKTGAEEP